MTDYSELKRLAEAANAYAEEDWHTPERLFIAMEKADAEFVSGCSPFSVLALIAENERQAEDLGKTELRALKFIHQCSAHADLYRELRAECDQLKAENEALHKDARRWRCVRNAIPMQSPYAVWREGSHVVLGKDADQMVDNFLLSCKAVESE